MAKLLADSHVNKVLNNVEGKGKRHDLNTSADLNVTTFQCKLLYNQLLPKNFLPSWFGLVFGKMLKSQKDLNPNFAVDHGHAKEPY